MLRWLSQIEESLAKIHADNLTEDCRAQIAQNKEFSGIRHEKLEIFINYFLSSLNGGRHQRAEPPEAEKVASLVNNIRIL
jgi:hypothetical protein